MPWFPEIAGSAFCETVQLRRRIIERQQLPRSCWLEVLEPSNAEFIAALAAGNNSHHILQIGCGISTIALAAAARATGSYLLSIHIDKEKQEIINEHVQYLGLAEYVKFITDEPRNVIPRYDGVDFAFFLGDPGCCVELFDLLRLKHEAIVVADNAFDEAMNEYIKHVRRQPGIHSSTLPMGRGIEVTKILSWNEFNSGVQQARISTEEKSIEDVFCVVDSESHAPLDPYVWDTVRGRMLERITAHRKK